MIIVNRSKTHIFNFEKLTEVFLSYNRSNNSEICYHVANDAKTYVLETYSFNTDAKIAMRMLCEALAINRQDVFYMPNEQLIQAYIAKGHQSVTRAENGKKTVRRGGS